MGGVLLLIGLIAHHPGAADGAEPARIAVLTESWGPPTTAVGLRDGLLALGYRENEHFVLGVRFTQGDTAALPAAARDVVQQGVELIFAAGTSAAKAAQMATSRIPIVFAAATDPVGLGLIQSFARPGGNITGVTDLDLELYPKRLELFRDLVPGLKRVLFPYNAADPYAQREVRIYREAAARLGLVLVERPLRTREESQTALARILRSAVDGIVAPGPVSLNIPELMAQATTPQRVPTMFQVWSWVEGGGLASYGPNAEAAGRQAARLVDKILKGASPATIPVEVNTQVEFTISLKAARALGLTIPREVLYQANRILR